MPQLNKEKRTAMVEALQQKNKEKWEEFHPVIECQPQRLVLDPEDIEEAITPFCMEMTDDEILHKSQSYNTDKIETGAALQQGIIIGSKLIRDGK